MTYNEILLRKIRLITWLFILGLFLSGITAIPLETELRVLHSWVMEERGAGGGVARAWAPEGLAAWILTVEKGLTVTNADFPFLAYGTDWLAFGHIVIAIGFWGAIKDPVKNQWLYSFGLIACGLIIPWALIFGSIRGLPLAWRLIDCSFGVFGSIPLLMAKKWISQLNLQVPQSQT